MSHNWFHNAESSRRLAPLLVLYTSRAVPCHLLLACANQVWRVGDWNYKSTKLKLTDEQKHQSVCW